MKSGKSSFVILLIALAILSFIILFPSSLVNHMGREVGVLVLGLFILVVLAAFIMPSIGMIAMRELPLEIKTTSLSKKIFKLSLLCQIINLYPSRLKIPDNVTRESVFPKGKRTYSPEISMGYRISIPLFFLYFLVLGRLVNYSDKGHPIMAFALYFCTVAFLAICANVSQVIMNVVLFIKYRYVPMQFALMTQIVLCFIIFGGWPKFLIFADGLYTQAD
jgi:hypothetical protein